jgi:signal transduction histidine kinase
MPYPGQLALLAVAYFAAAKLSLLLAIPPGYATAIWPPSGIAVAAVLAHGARLWPGIWLGAALVNYGVQSSAFAAILIASGNTLEALAAGALVRAAIGVPRRFERGEDVFKFIGIAALSSAIAASVALVPLAAGHGLSREGIFWNWWTWWQGDFTGIVIVAPLLLTWGLRGRPFRAGRRTLELALFALVLAAVAQATLGDPDSDRHPFARSFLVMPFVIWAAFRFGQRELTAAIGAVSALAIWHTVQGRGPFYAETLNLSLLALSAFNAVFAATGLALGAVLRERRIAMEALKARHDELEEKVKARTLELERASRAKSDFLAKMSHELRTPLNSLLILARLLADNAGGNLTEKQVRYARTIHDAGVDLLGLITDVLDLARIESGAGIRLAFAPVALRGLREQLERTFAPQAQEKGLRLAIEIDAAAPASVETDGKRLEQILRNLLANAFKYTREGSVTLRVAPNGGRVAFSVTDTGIGIASERQAGIFDAFQKQDGPVTPKEGGAGLGLSISLELARLLGGELRLAETSERGSTFVLTLPAAR